jgi:hypothetical protein
MTDITKNRDEELEWKELQLIPFARPSLVAGGYTAAIRQELDGRDGKGEQKVCKTFNKELHFHVTAPRFNLDPSVIASVYPPANHYGSYQQSLPHIVFTRKTLPWERLIDKEIPVDTDEVYPPWLALLLFEEEELKTFDIQVKTLLAKDLLGHQNKKAGVYFPTLEPEPWNETNNTEKQPSEEKDPDPSYNVLDLPASLFHQMAPREEELKLLAHARRVNAGDQQIAGINSDGWYSVLIGNRLPAAEKKNIVFLVSLEGYRDFLQEPKPNIVGDKVKVRLPLLYSWWFTAKGPTFTELTRRINEKADLFRVTPEQKINNPEVKDALEYGYVPVKHQFRNGDQSISWYRGPFAPLAISRPVDDYVFHAADGLLRYDAETGMFDVSYAAAWQLGRLLALKNTNFSKALNLWKSSYKKDFIRGYAALLIKEQFKGSLNDSLVPFFGEKEKARVDEIQKKIDRMDEQIRKINEQKGKIPDHQITKLLSEVWEGKEAKELIELLQKPLSDTWENIETNELMKNLSMQLYYQKLQKEGK